MSRNYAHGARRRPLRVAAVVGLSWCFASALHPIVAHAQSTQARSTRVPSAPAQSTIPRGPEEDPSLDARDFRGVWRALPMRTKRAFRIDDPPLTPIADALVRSYEALGRAGRIVASARTTCRAGAVNATLIPFDTVTILQNDEGLTVLFASPNIVRRLWFATAHSANVEPSYTGHSVAHWDGETLVVDTIGTNGVAEIDAGGAGIPSSTGLHMVERITKSADGRLLDFDITITDPAVLSAPLKLARRWEWAAGERWVEEDCAENPRFDTEAREFFPRELFRPICKRIAGHGDATSRVVCERSRNEAR
jgi:hypothetical protein